VSNVAENNEVKLNCYEDLPDSPVTMGTSLVYKTGDWRTMRPLIDREKCKKCGICWKFCPDMAIREHDDYPEVDYDYCKGCGICANECPFDAIEMVEEESL